MERNIIINDYNKLNVLANNKNYYVTSLNVYKVYAGHVYNPPYFNNIILNKENTSYDDLKMVWNMTLINGRIYVDKKYKSFFKNINKEYENKIEIIKNNNYTYIFPKYRVLEFIIAGTMKGGTTAAITNLNMHPEINMVKEEIHYFDKKENYQKGLEWYKRHFNYKKKVVGDKAPDVMYQESCLELLQICNPQVKIILFLRNPIERAYSHWKMTRDLFRNKRSFEDCVEDEINNRWNENRTYDVSFWYHFIQRGLYYKQIENILKYFSKDNILILITEEIKKNMDLEYQKIFKFLNVEEFHSNFVEEFSSKSPDMIKKNSKLYKKLKNIYKEDIKNLEKFVGYKIKWL